MTCPKCGHAVFGRATKRGAHPICSRRKLKRGERRRRSIALISKTGWDLEATEARNFKNPRSRVMQDGREVLYGLDYRKRVREVLERDGFRCRVDRIVKKDRLFCGAPAEHAHHIIKRSDGRDDRASNLVAICGYCHTQMHPEKRTRFDEVRSVA